MSTRQHIFITLFLVITPLLALGQASSFLSWSVDPLDLTNGKVVLQQPNTKTLHFTVRVQRFLQPGSSTVFQPVSVTIKLSRLEQNTTSPIDLSSEGTITSSVFTGDNVFADVPISLILKSSGTTNDVLKNNDQILLRIKNGSIWNTANNTYWVVVNPANSNPTPWVCHIYSGSSLADSPSNLRSTNPRANTILLKWDDNSSSETGYRIRRDNAAAGGLTTIFEVPPNTTEFVDNTVQENTLYSYLVHLSGNYPYNTNRICTTPVDCPPTIIFHNTSTYPSEIKAGNSIDFINGINITSGSVLISAGQTISFKPGTFLSEGTNVVAKIAPCSGTIGGRVKNSDSYLGSPYLELTSPPNTGERQLHVFPNPASKEIVIKTDAELDDEWKVELYNVNGTMIKFWNAYSENGNMRVNIQDISVGVYYVAITTRNTVRFTKFIISR